MRSDSVLNYNLKPVLALLGLGIGLRSHLVTSFEGIIKCGLRSKPYFRRNTGIAILMVSAYEFSSCFYSEIVNIGVEVFLQMII